MKLFEIYQSTPDDTWYDDAISTDISGSALRRVSDLRKNPNHKFLGSGGFAYVGTDDDENFGDVYRVASATEGGSMYHRFLSSHPMIAEKNLFFPRIRSVDHNKELTQGVDHQTSVMERLLPYNTPAIHDNLRLMRAIVTRYLNAGAYDICNKLSPRTEPSWGSALVLAIRHALQNYNTEYIKDPKLMQAIKILHMMEEQMPDTGFDIHYGNLMWRPNAYQPQLVFTDPFVY